MTSINLINTLFRKTVNNNFLINELRIRDNLWQQIRHKRRGFKEQKPWIYGIPNERPLDPKVEDIFKSNKESIIPSEMAELRFAFPEFLPSPIVEFRNKIKDKIMRNDLIKRRTVLEIPEFYVGSILAVTISDPFAPGKQSKFVGICVHREGQGTYANFTLRNRVDGQGVEIRYDLYNPTIREIQVLKLEKRLDSELFYLRDALPEFSTFPFDMTPEPLLPGQEVPINPMKVIMKKWPWTVKWEARIDDIRGIAQLPDLPDYQYINKWKLINENEKYDLMKEYRQHTPEEDQLEIWEDIKKHKEEITEIRNIERRHKLLQQTVKKTF